MSDPISVIAAIPREESLVIAQLGQSLDGRIATLTGHSRYINRHAALDHLHRLRAEVDAVVVGIGTVLADDPRLNVRRVPGRHPARVVIDPGGRMPRGAACMEEDGVRRIVLHASPGHVPEGAEEVLLPRTKEGGFDPLLIVSTLRAMGFHRLLIEGGARTVSHFIEKGAVDRLHVLVAPMIIGSGKPGIDLPPIAVVDDALRPLTTVYVLADGDVLFDCNLREAVAGEKHG